MAPLFRAALRSFLVLLLLVPLLLAALTPRQGDAPGRLLRPAGNFHAYSVLLASGSGRQSLYTALIAAAGSVAVAVPLGLAAAFCFRPAGRIGRGGELRRHLRAADDLPAETTPPRSRLLLGLVLPALLLPGLLAALLPPDFAAGRLAERRLWLIITHGLAALPLVALVILADLSQLDPLLLSAAAASGADPGTAFRRVLLPLLRSALGAAALLAALVSLTESILALLPATFGASEVGPLATPAAGLLALLALLLVAVLLAPRVQ